MAICFNCEKGTSKGMTHTHHRGVAGGRWRKRAPHVARTFKSNLQNVTILNQEIETQIHLCTKCLKRIKKDIKDGKKPAFILKKTINKVVKKESSN
jgi:ribosomal protein L28